MKNTQKGAGVEVLFEKDTGTIRQVEIKLVPTWTWFFKLLWNALTHEQVVITWRQ